MQFSTAQTLLALNQQFYRTVADHFDATRQGWTPGQLDIVPYFQPATKQNPVTVIDVGCGNGRLARLLAEQGIHCHYTGVDGDARLLDLAAEAIADLPEITANFIQADLSDPHWADPLQNKTYDVAVCLATIQHLPGYRLRLHLVKTLHNLTRQWVILSCWQFLTSQRFVQKQIDWAEIGLSDSDVEPGDALLPWQSGVHAIRYVHQVDETELAALAADSGLQIHATFRSDGKEGNLNLYGILQRPPTSPD